MSRAILIPALLLLALPAVADDELEVKLKRIEARIARLRADARRDNESRAEIDKQIAEIDARIAAAQKIDQTALGATKLEDMRTARAKLEALLRRSRRAIQRGSREAAAKVTSLEKERTPVDLEDLFRRSLKGDAAARAELKKIRARIDTSIGAAQLQPGLMGARMIQFGGGGVLQVINGRVIRQGGVPARAASEPPKTAKRKKEIPPEEQKKRAEQDHADHVERADSLEKQIVEMTRKVLELEQRLRDLQQKVAQAERG